MGGAGNGAQAAGCLLQPRPMAQSPGSECPTEAGGAVSMGDTGQEPLPSSQSPVRAGRASVGLSTQDLEAHPVTLQASPARTRSPRWRAALEALVASPAVVARTCCPLVAVWRVSTAGGRSWERLVSSSELPGAEPGWLRGTQVGTGATKSELPLSPLWPQVRRLTDMHDGGGN